MYVALSIGIFFLLGARSRRDLGSYISNSWSLSAYLIVRPGLPLLQAIGRYEISLARVYLFLGFHSAQRARKSLGLVRSSSFFFFKPEDR